MTTDTTSVTAQLQKRRRSFKHAAVIVGAMTLTIWLPRAHFATTAAAPPPAAAQEGIPDLEGVFVRADTIGGGSWDGANAAIPKAILVDGPGPGRGDGRGRGRAAPVPMPLGGAGCAGGGFINLMQHSSAFHIVQQKDEVVLIGEMPMTRRIYMDGRKHRT